LLAKCACSKVFPYLNQKQIMSEKEIEFEISVSRPKYWEVNVKLSKQAWGSLSQACKKPLSLIGLVAGGIAISIAVSNSSTILQNPTVKAILPVLGGEQQR
jgi:hypothetical protein